MMICADCGEMFEEAVDLFETHGFHYPPYERLYACPHCQSTDIHDTFRCELCGEWIAGEYIVTADDNRICCECYTLHDIFDD